MKGRQRWVEIPPKSLTYKRTFLYQGDVQVSDALLAHGYQYLGDFDVVLLRQGAHQFQAISLPRGEDYGRCEATLPTMRVVPYWAHSVWLIRNEATDALLRYWREGTDDWQLALLRAVYLAQPRIYLLTARCYEELSEEYRGYMLWATRDMNDWTAGVFVGDAMLWKSHGNVSETAEGAFEAARRWVDAN